MRKSVLFFVSYVQAFCYFWDLKVLNNLCIHFTPKDLHGFDCLLANRLIYVIIIL